MRIISWNVNGIRAIQKKDFIGSLKSMNPDILCIQETKAQDDQVHKALEDIDYKIYCNSAIRKGYSGTAILTKTEPINIIYDMGIEEHDQEGRVITAEFKDFFLITVYTPNSGSGLKRLDYRQQWDKDFLVYIKKLEELKPVITCGDFNVAHCAIDLARPQPNYNKSAGYTQKEIDGMDNLIQKGFIDTFRAAHPDEIKYSWWSYRAGARPRNIGWRIDYFLVSEALSDKVEKAEILNEIMGSDHCPVSVDIRTT
jgi:exodeoxyribonuclease-3